jgi:hypothetical protein
LKELPKKERMPAHGNLKGKGDYTKKPNEGADVMIERCVTQAVDEMMTAASATIKAHGGPLVNTQLIYVETDVAYKGPAAYEAAAVGAIQKLIDKQIADKKARFVTDSHPVGTPGYRIEMQVRAETKGSETTIKVKGDIYKLPDKLMVSVTAPTGSAVVTGTVKAIHFADSGDGPVEEILQSGPQNTVASGLLKIAFPAVSETVTMAWDQLRTGNRSPQ